MSAFLHSNTHIDALIRAGLEHRDSHSLLRWFQPATNPPIESTLTVETATDVGRMLVAANVANLIYLYEDRLSAEETEPPAYSYVPSTRSVVFYTAPTHSPVEVLKALASYEYQCCDMPGWEQTEAYAFCRVLRLHLINALPGYAAADTWSL